MANNNEKLGQEPAFAAYSLDKSTQLGQSETEYYSIGNEGMSKRFYAACAAKNDFDELTLELKEKIVGEKVPRSETRFDNNIAKQDIWSIEYAKWLAKGRSKWIYMQADELLKQENQ